MQKLLNWLDDRTGYRQLVNEALYENIPGGSRWRYVWGSTLVFTFFVQVVTGIFLWMCYSPSTQTAWESVYYLQEEMSGGWLLRGIHHYAAQLMVVLLGIHLLQVVIDGAYRAPREMNYWIGLILMQIVLGLALTGYLLPWDQKGYWATKVATEIAGSAGEQVPVLAVGGADYGHHTITRFFALHAGVLPGLLVVLLVLHIGLFRRHGIHTKVSKDKPRPDQDFWPDQVLKDAIACLAVLLAIVGLAWFMRAELGAPADPAENYSAARPEWYFLFLFQFLKYFPGEYGKVIGAIVIPGAVMLFMFLMPFIGRRRGGHLLNVAVIALVIVGAVVLTGLAWMEDNYANVVDRSSFSELETALDELAVDIRKNGDQSKYFGKSPAEQIAERYADDEAQLAALNGQLATYQKYMRSQDFLNAVDDARINAERVRELATQGIPPTGALNLIRNDAKTQGPKLFQRYCASCHDHVNEEGNGISMVRPLSLVEKKGKEVPEPNGAPNLFRFASRAWLAGLLDPKRVGHAKIDRDTWQVTDAKYFGNTAHRAGDMVQFVNDTFTDLDEDEKGELENVIAWLSAEASLNFQSEDDAELHATVVEGATEGADNQAKLVAAATEALEYFSCTDCHRFHNDEPGADAPDLTGYGSRQWLIDFISDPTHVNDNPKKGDFSRFYGEENDRMPRYAPAGEPDEQLMTPEKIALLVDWLREEWYEVPTEKPSGD